MLKVDLRLGESAVFGIGLFATEFIPNNTIVWEFDSNVDKVYTPKEFENLHKDNENILSHLGWTNKKTGKIIVPTDNAKYLNYSDLPNCYSVYDEGENEVTTYTLRDINIDEEITLNFRDLDELR